uniref:Probable DNA polymerase n=1 Tax=Amanita phalloides TaxID=67723 RepID=A0A5Q0N2C2_AMAPH|nr:DNA polymerase type B [Amanita phalloides]QFZ98662.1 DNA polymerase type B [Amanita phalloides]
MNKLIELNLNNCVIYYHNLGSFDGYFLFKGLLELPDIDIDNVNSIIDDLHRIISIGINWKGNKFNFKDSLRLFPLTLSEFTKIFEVEGKLNPYNPLFNKLSLFKDNLLLNQFINYSKQDSICLLKALDRAQDIYLEEHKVDFASIKFKTRKTLNNNRYLPIKINHKFLNKIRLLHKFNKK